MILCKNCKYWYNDSNLKYREGMGVCEAVSNSRYDDDCEISHDSPSNIACVHGRCVGGISNARRGDETGEFLTKANFGCVLGESKYKEYEPKTIRPPEYL